MFLYQMPVLLSQAFFIYIKNVNYVSILLLEKY